MGLNRIMHPPPPRATPVMSIEWLPQPTIPRGQHHTLPSQSTSQLNAPWGSPLNLSANTSTTDDEHRDAMARDKGKAREMPEDVYGGSHR